MDGEAVKQRSQASTNIVRHPCTRYDTKILFLYHRVIRVRVIRRLSTFDALLTRRLLHDFPTLSLFCC